MLKKISVVLPCYNEEENVEKLAEVIIEEFRAMPQYDYELLYIDNCSQDKTPQILRQMAAANKKIKVILNSRNFGHIRSPFYGLTQATGDAVMLMVTDFQDPPELIKEFIKKWEEGHEIVLGVKKQSLESPVMFFVRSSYYHLIDKMSDIKLVKNYTGFGLYDAKIIRILRELKDPYPYFRGLILELGFNIDKIYYTQPLRRRGITKNNFYTLYDMAMLGIFSHSKVPLRLVTIAGLLFAIISFIMACAYIIAKLLFWERFSLGIAPMMIGMFFFASIQLFVLGVIGEYVGWIFTKVNHRPLVIEKDRINFQ